MDFFYRGIPRLDWGFGNPNITAALLAMLAVTALGSALVWKRCFWTGTLIAICLIVVLIHTLSRGGMVAYLAGSILLWISIRPSLDKKKIISILTAAVCLISYSIFLGGASRYVQGMTGVEDRSVVNRWLIYRAVPRMLLDAPDGWGDGNAAEAYQQWYQPEGRGESYLNLVNSHFTWMVEWSTCARVLYIFGWVSVLIISWPKRNYKWHGIVLAVWGVFFVSSSFSSVAHRVWIWPFPVILFILLVFNKFWLERRIITARCLVACPIISLAIYLCLLFSASIQGGNIKIFHHRDYVRIGLPKSLEKTAIIGNDKSILGERFGHRIRKYLQNHPESSITWYNEMPKNYNVYSSVVFVNITVEKLPELGCKRFIFLNPASSPPLWLQQNHQCLVLWGDLNPSFTFYTWQAAAGKNYTLTVKRLPAEGVFLENWLQELE